MDTIRQRAQHENLPEVTTILGTPDDPKLTPDSLNAAVMLRVYHEVAHPALLLPIVRMALKPGGRFAVIDHPGNGADHGINADVVRREVEQAGMQFVGLYDFTKGDQNDYIEVFERRKPALACCSEATHVSLCDPRGPKQMWCTSGRFGSFRAFPCMPSAIS